MTEREFFNTVLNGSEDVLQLFLTAVSSAGVGYCVIGGLAVNAYAEPVVSLDLDVVVTCSVVYDEVNLIASRPPVGLKDEVSLLLKVRRGDFFALLAEFVCF